jgi:hypothetical protein
MGNMILGGDGALAGYIGSLVLGVVGPRDKR